MTSVLEPASVSPHPAAELIEQFETTDGSLVHRLFPRRGSLAIACISSVLATYVPLLIVAWATLPSLTERYDAVRLPFLRDWNVMFMFFVTMPALVAYLVDDHWQLTSAIGRTLREDILALSPSDTLNVTTEWRNRFRQVNIWGQALGVVIGVIVAWANYRAYASPRVGHWTMHDGHLTVAGIVFLWAVCLFFALTTFYVIRSVAVAYFLRSLLKCSTIRVVPFHPDGSGGLRPVGAIGLKNQYLLSIYGLNVISLAIVSTRSLVVPDALFVLMALAAVLYALIGPVVFLAPLMQFRSGMMSAKIELMNEVAQRLRAELARIRVKLPRDEITKNDEELLERLRKIGAMVDDMPVWPFDARTVRKFLTAYLVPLVGSFGFPLVKMLFGYLSSRFAVH